MKLPFSLGVSSVVHAAVLVMAFAWAVDSPLEPEISGWQEVELRPVRFETIEIPVPRPLEVAAAPEISPEPPAEPAEPAPPPEPPKPKKKKKKRKKKTPVEPPAAQELAPVVVEKTKETAPAAPVVETRQEVAPKAIEPTFVSAVPRVAVPPRPPKAVGGTSTRATGSAPGPSAGELRGLRRGYLRGVYKLVDRNKRYPRIARRGRKQGLVVLSVTIDEAGKILEVRVAKSSGHGVLDRSAAETVRSLKRLPKPPGALGWSRHKIKVPIRYTLRR